MSGDRQKPYSQFLSRSGRISAAFPGLKPDQTQYCYHNNDADYPARQRRFNHNLLLGQQSVEANYRLLTSEF
jgi:hypothetical protein